MQIARLAALALATPWIAWAILRTFSLDEGYPLVPLVAFTPYAALTSPLPVIVAALLRRWAIAALALAAALALILAIVPRAMSDDAPDGTREGHVLTVMSANLDDGGADARALLRLAARRTST